MATEQIRGVLLLLQLAGVAVAVAVALRWPVLGSNVFSRIEDFARRIGERRVLSVAATGLLLIVVRLSVTPLIGVPVPQVHDAFSYLLAADTFVHGRLTNPPHSMSAYLQTFHEIQSPTYMSKYPPAPGAVLAIGQKLGHPWIGVLLSVAVLCASITWMLQGWFPARWALLGGILAVGELGGVNEWVSSYSGGEVAAIGGALMIGAFPRILLHCRLRHATLFALGIGILANSRPYEGLVFSAVLVLALVFCLIKKRNLSRPNIKMSNIKLKIWVNVAAPVVGVMVLVGSFMAYYNLRVTGNPLLLPYQLYTRTYEDSPIFLWGALEPPKQYQNPQFAAFYTAGRDAWLAQRELTWSGLKLAVFDKLMPLQQFYAPPEFAVPILVALLWLPRSRKVRFWFAICAALTVAAIPVVWGHARYEAAFTAAVYALIVFGLKRLRAWSLRGRPIGVGVARALVFFHLLMLPAQAGALGLIHKMGHVESAWARDRFSIQSKLESTPGQHLVLVRYPADFYPGRELVFNDADIDHAKVVWAREIPGLDLSPLLNYFHGRRLWVAEAGVRVKLSMCDGASASGGGCGLQSGGVSTPSGIR